MADGPVAAVDAAALADVLTPALLATYVLTGTTLVAKSAQFPIEIGDSKQADFYPQIKLPLWDNEVNFSIRLLDNDPTVPVVRATENKILWEKPHVSAQLFDQGFDEETGGFEFAVIWPAPPPSNVLQFSVQLKGLTANYQLPLTQEKPKSWWTGVITETEAFDKDGNRRGYRPAHVVGSYVFYHATMTGNYQGGKNYKSGKAFQIDRPWAQDANGVRVWAVLDVNVRTGLMTITVPQEFLDAAVYPVLVDPTFGYSTPGGSSDNNGTIPTYSFANTTPASSGTLDSITVRVEVLGTPGHAGVALYSNVGGAASARLAATEPGTAGPSSGTADVTTPCSYGSLTLGVQYWFGLRFDTAGYGWKYDSLGVNGGNGLQDQGTNVAFPATAANAGQFNESITIYGNFTTGGGGSTWGPLLGLQTTRLVQ